MATFRGNIIWFCPMRGFGFIGREGAPDVFLHRGAIKAGNLNPDAHPEVEFDVTGPEGLQAENVTIVKY